MRVLKLLVVLSMGALVLSLPFAPASAQDEEMSIAEVAAAAGDFDSLVAALGAAGLADTFSDCEAGPFTVLAPNDDAFAAALEALDISAEDLLADSELLTSVLTYHVVEGEVLAADVVELDGEEVATLNGASVTVAVADDGVMVNDSLVVATDIPACNGVIHVVDTVLIPPAGDDAAAAEEEEATEEEATEEEATEEEATEEEATEEEATEEEATEEEATEAAEEEATEEEAAAAAAEDDLAQTGNETFVLALAALVLLGAGVMLRGTGRRVATPEPVEPAVEYEPFYVYDMDEYLDADD